MDRKLQNERQKNDISRLKGLYRILQVENLEKVEVGICRNEVSKLLKHTHEHTHEVSTLLRMRRALIKRPKVFARPTKEEVKYTNLNPPQLKNPATRLSVVLSRI